MLNGDLFDDDDLNVGCRSVLDQYHEVATSYGRNRTMFYCISVSVDLDPYSPQYTLLHTEGHAFLRTYEGAGDEEEYMYTNDLLTDDDSSDEDYSLSDNE